MVVGFLVMARGEVAALHPELLLLLLLLPVLLVGLSRPGLLVAVLGFSSARTVSGLLMLVAAALEATG